MNKEELTLAGMNVEEFLMRLMNNENLVRMFIEKFLQDNTYESLVAAVEAGEMKNAELACHTLKGVSGNLSLTELFTKLQEQLKCFRAGQFEEALEYMDQIKDLYEKAAYHMNRWLQE